MKSLDDYPASSWRPHQKRYAKIVRQAGLVPEACRIGIEGPCGSGKSLGYLRAALSPGFPPSSVLSTTRAHLRQLENTLKEHFPGESWAVLRGRSFYTCCGAPPAGEDLDPAEEWSGKRKCRKGPDCLYEQAIRACAVARVVLQCTIGFLYRKQYWSSTEGNKLNQSTCARFQVVDRDVCILDEAHEYLDVRRTFETHELKLRRRDMPMPPNLQREFDYARIAKGSTYKRGYILLSDGPGQEWAGSLGAYLKGLTTPAQMEKRRPATANTPAKWERVRERYQKEVDTRVKALENESGDVVSLQFDAEGEMTLKIEPLFAHVGEKLAPVEIFTSATLKDYAPLLKIEPQWLERIPEVFDWDKAVSTYVLPDEVGGFGNRAIDAATMLELYEQEDRPMTVALFMSKAHVKSASLQLKGKPGVLIQGDDGEISEVVEKALANWSRPHAPFLCLYSGWVGTDLPGEKWLILGSATRSPLGPVHEARKLRRMGGGWNDREKVIGDRVKLQQGLGRALRSAEDRAIVIWTDNKVFSDMGLCTQTARLK